jgi:uncharacterized protein YyaL (SSP411 family)
VANRLASAKSPYLLQHKDNPVDWWPWCEEAFEEARRRDVPVLVSVGYSTCHWCHVMAHESFEDEETARIMNERFVSVKVDREERPDIDEALMTAVQALSGHGGWPMTVFMTPDGKPFFAGTYFPKEERGGLPSFKSLLLAISETYKNSREEVEEQADKLSRLLDPPVLERSFAFDVQLVRSAFEFFRAIFDEINGGFGEAPKFPQAPNLEFLQRYLAASFDPDCEEMLRKTLDSMALGGLYDHIGGGFFRYCVDAAWRIPHFEKMLYDNALLCRIYLWAGQHFGSLFYRRIANETAEFILRELADPEGGFYSALDADTGGQEGGYYLWSYDELVATLAPLDKAERDMVVAYLGASKEGNFEGLNHLSSAAPLEDLNDEKREVVERARRVLFEARSKREKRPACDDKVLASWNGYALWALADLGRASGDPRYLRAAERCADFLTNRMGGPLGPNHSWRGGKLGELSFASDLASVGLALVSLTEATGDWRWTEKATHLADSLIEHFVDDRDGLLFLTAEPSEAEKGAGKSGEDGSRNLSPRPKPLLDGAEPSPSSLAALLFVKLGRLYDRSRYLQAAGRILERLAPLAARHPAAFGFALSGMLFWTLPPVEVVVSGDLSPEMEARVWSSFYPNFLLARSGPSVPQNTPLFAGKTGGSAVYVCFGYSCDKPARGSKELSDSLSRAVALQREAFADG